MNNNQVLAKNIRMPLMIEFQTIAACNARCTVCPWPELPSQLKGHRMSAEILDKVIQSIHTLKPVRVAPYLNNEPLLDKKLEDCIERIVEPMRNVEIEISTNGSFISVQRAENLFRAGVTELYFSVFGTSATSYKGMMSLEYEKTRKNIDQVIEFQQQYYPDVNIKIIQVLEPYQKQQNEIPQHLLHWQEQGIEILHYGYLDRAGNVNQFSDVKPQRDKTKLPAGCELNRQYEKIYIMADGSITFCCHDWRKTHVLGNIMDIDLETLWYSQTYSDVRGKVDGSIDSDEDFLCRSCKLCLTD